MSNLKITGNTTPMVGVPEPYSIEGLFGNDPLLRAELLKNPSDNSFDSLIRWTVWIFEHGVWKVQNGNEKTGATVIYTFSQTSLKRKGIRLKVEKNGETATIDIKTKKGLEAKITNVVLLNSKFEKPTKPFAYGEKIIASVHCVNTDLRMVKVTLWEDDGHKKDSGNTQIQYGKGPVKDGRAYIEFVLSPKAKDLANSKLAAGDKNEGKNHEYYVTAEIFEKAPKRFTTRNTNVANPDYKPEEPKKETPAQQKGPSKKEERGILDSAAETVHDWWESTVSVVDEMGESVREAINSLLTVEVPDEGEEKKNCGERYCIKKGDKNELVREINIRLAGFGGNVPKDEFTDRTEKMIKQFQRDYMKVPETGKVCGNVLVAIDEFSKKFDISNTLWKQIKCSCSTKGEKTISELRGINELNNCNGFGDHTGKSTYKALPHNESNHNYEYPGIHRSLLFGIKALQFYFSKQTVYTMDQVTSGYRCRFKNYLTTNHQGKAIDIQFSKNGMGIRGPKKENLPKLKDIRDGFYIKYLGAQKNWPEKNLFSTEPIDLLYKANGSLRYDHTFSWLHIDVRQFESTYLEDKYFCKNTSSLNGKSIVQLAKELGFDNTCMCLKSKTVIINSNETITGSCEDKFKKVAPIILNHEGGYKNEPSKDKGDPTNRGISWPIWQKYAKEDLGIEPTADNQKKISEAQATIIYKKRYWEPKGYCEIENLKVALMIYDWTITSGGAIEEVQKLLVNDYNQTITIDGGMGIKTAKAVNSVSDQTELLNKIAEIRRAYYAKGARDGWFSADYSKGLDDRVTKCLNYEI